MSLLVLSGCPKNVPRPASEPGQSAAPPSSIDPALDKEVTALAAEALALVKERDDALWTHWTLGVPLELEKPAQKHAGLFEDEALVKVRLARSKGVGHPIGLKRFESWLLGERLARASAAANGALAQLEETATFKLEGKELRWRDLGRLLANEKSAVKRKALWVASREAVAAVAEGCRKRDEAIGLTQVPDDETLVRARALLDETQGEWKQLLEELARSELGLPGDKVTRADLPRLLKPSSVADPVFPRQQQATKATAVLSALGFYGLPGLTLDLSESAKKNPLPLTIAPGGASDVRVCFRPAGGVRDLSSLLGELGRALALHETKEPPEALSRLAIPVEAEASALLFAQLAESRVWLKEQGVSEADSEAAARSVRALRLFSLRRAAGNLLAAKASVGQSPEATAEAWRVASVEALGVPLSPEDLPRWRLESDALGRGAGLLGAYALASAWRKALPDHWWKQPQSAAALRSGWAGMVLKAPVGLDGGAGLGTDTTTGGVPH
jgi:hypothetical protein